MEAAIIIVFVVIVGAVAQVFLGPDNAIEEASEDFIQHKTGVDIDLSPDTPEKKQ